MRSRLAASLFVLSCCLGCSRFERISECRALVSTVNARLGQLEAQSKGAESAENYEKLSKGYAELSGSVASLAIAKGAAAAEVKEYSDLMRSTSKACADLAAAMRAQGKVDVPRRELDRLTRKEKLLAARLDAFCQSA